MFKATPNPPDTSIPYDPALDPQKIKAATDRAINFYLNPGALKISIPSTSSCKANRIFLIDPTVDEETLLVEARESLASATVMLGDFAGTLEGPSRNTVLGIAQVVMLGELAVSQALDNVVP